MFCEELFSGKETHVENTRDTVSEAMDRIQPDLVALQSGLARLHATAPLVGPVPMKISDARRRWYEVELATWEALMAGRQALALVTMTRARPERSAHRG